MVYTALSDDSNTVSQFTRRKPITITTNGTSTPVDYQVKLTIAYESEMQADFDDLRFNTLSEAYIDYWIEDYTASTTATVWVELSDAITDPGDDTILMYYGNPGLSDGGDGADTFIGFGGLDSLDGWTGDTTKCTVDQTFQGKTTCMKCYDDSGAASFSIKKDVSFPSTFILEADIAEDSDYYTMWGAGDSTHSIRCGVAFRPNGIAYYWDSSNYDLTDIDPFINTWYHEKFVVKGASGSVVDLYIDDVLKKSNKTINATPTFISLSFVGGSGTGNAYINSLFVRKYITNEPTASYGASQHQRRISQFIG